MKITQEMIQQLRSVLAEYIVESGENRGKFMFSKDLGMIENQLYNEVSDKVGIFGYEQFSRTFDNYQDEVEGELAVVEDDLNPPPFLEVV